MATASIPMSGGRLRRVWERYVKTPFIGRPVYSWVISLAVASLTTRYFEAQFASAYEDFRTSIPGAMLALVGFIITALAILISTGTGTVAQFIKDERPDAWPLIIKQISGAAKLAGAIAIIVSIEPFLRTLATRYFEPDIVATAWMFMFSTLITLIILFTLRVIWLLERTTIPVPTARSHS